MSICTPIRASYMPREIDWRDQPMDLVQEVLRALWRGGLVAFPDRGGYAIAGCGIDPAAVGRLLAAGAEHLTVAVRGVADLDLWLQDPARVARRFAARCWPGPLTLQVRGESSIARLLPQEVRDRAIGNGILRLRTPDHQAFYEAVLHFAGPLVFSEISDTTGVKALLTGEHDILIEDAAFVAGERATLVDVQAESWSTLRPGAIAEEDLRGHAARRILFACTGNTCRSPLAAALCRKMLAEKLGCPAEALPKRGYIVESAGVAAAPGRPPSDAAVEIGRELGVDLTDHRSRPMTLEDLQGADDIFVMTRRHLQALRGHGINRIATPQLLATTGEEIVDPIGGEQEVYRTCAAQIAQHLERRLAELL